MLRAKGAAVVEPLRVLSIMAWLYVLRQVSECLQSIREKDRFFRRPFPDPRISGHFASLPEVRPVAKMGKLKLLLGFYELMSL